MNVSEMRVVGEISFARPRIDPFRLSTEPTLTLPCAPRSMTPDRWQLIKELFSVALELDESLRSAWLDERCRDDQALRAEVDSSAAHVHPLAIPRYASQGPRRARPPQSSSSVLKEQQALVALRQGVLHPRHKMTSDRGLSVSSAPQHPPPDRHPYVHPPCGG